MAKITDNFDSDEFKCPCCGEEHMDRDFVGMLQYARDYAEIPFKINSGWRCEKHNKAVGGTVGSSHSKGLAADIAVWNSRGRMAILKGLIDAGFDRIGIGRDFIHVDADTDKMQNIVWLYK